MSEQPTGTKTTVENTININVKVWMFVENLENSCSMFYIP